jgi:acetylornithine deacetylase/succinyl-diaminopimelate desuccinylase-like protein
VNLCVAESATGLRPASTINFGPVMLGKKYPAHNANEFKVADLDADMQMFTEMLVRIDNLKQMQ